MSMQKRVYKRLEEAFSPVFLDVIDESDQHRGHGGWREGVEPICGCALWRRLSTGSRAFRAIAWSMRR